MRTKEKQETIRRGIYSFFRQTRNIYMQFDQIANAEALRPLQIIPKL